MQGIHLKIDNLENLKGNFNKLAFLKLKFADLVTIIDKLEIPLSF